MEHNISVKYHKEQLNNDFEVKVVLNIGCEKKRKVRYKCIQRTQTPKSSTNYLIVEHSFNIEQDGVKARCQNTGKTLRR